MDAAAVMLPPAQPSTHETASEEVAAPAQADPPASPSAAPKAAEVAPGPHSSRLLWWPQPAGAAALRASSPQLSDAAAAAAAAAHVVAEAVAAAAAATAAAATNHVADHKGPGSTCEGGERATNSQDTTSQQAPEEEEDGDGMDDEDPPSDGDTNGVGRDASPEDSAGAGADGAGGGQLQGTVGGGGARGVRRGPCYWCKVDSTTNWYRWEGGSSVCAACYNQYRRSGKFSEARAQAIASGLTHANRLGGSSGPRPRASGRRPRSGISKRQNGIACSWCGSHTVRLHVTAGRTVCNACRMSYSRNGQFSEARRASHAGAAAGDAGASDWQQQPADADPDADAAAVLNALASGVAAGAGAPPRQLFAQFARTHQPAAAVLPQPRPAAHHGGPGGGPAGGAAAMAAVLGRVRPSSSACSDGSLLDEGEPDPHRPQRSCSWCQRTTTSRSWHDVAGLSGVCWACTQYYRIHGHFRVLPRHSGGNGLPSPPRADSAGPPHRKRPRLGSVSGQHDALGAAAAVGMGVPLLPAAEPAAGGGSQPAGGSRDGLECDQDVDMTDRCCSSCGCRQATRWYCLCSTGAHVCGSCQKARVERRQEQPQRHTPEGAGEDEDMADEPAGSGLGERGAAAQDDEARRQALEALPAGELARQHLQLQRQLAELQRQHAQLERRHAHAVQQLSRELTLAQDSAEHLMEALTQAQAGWRSARAAVNHARFTAAADGLPGGAAAEDPSPPTHEAQPKVEADAGAEPLPADPKPSSSQSQGQGAAAAGAAGGDTAAAEQGVWQGLAVAEDASPPDGRSGAEGNKGDKDGGEERQGG